VAELAYSGYWLVDEHIAELLVQRRESMMRPQLFTKVLLNVLPRPEFQQALGELYLAMGQSDSAEILEPKGTRRYLDSAQSGGVHYYHHLTDFYADVRENGPEAVKWARKDIALRRNPSTLAALAWATVSRWRVCGSSRCHRRIPSSGATDARLFYKAGMIHQSARRNGMGKEYLRKAAELNPHYQSFHVHR